MINQQLLDFIKSQLQLGLTKEKISSELLTKGWNTQDIEEGFNEALGKNISLKTSHEKIKSIFKKEILLIPSLFAGGYLLMNIIVLFLVPLISSLGLFGAALFVMAISGLIPLLGIICAVIILIVFIRNIFKVNKLKRETLTSIPNGELSLDYKKFKKYCNFLLIINIIVVFLVVFIPIYLFYSAKHKEEVRKVEVRDSKRENEGKRIEANLLDFKAWIGPTQGSFVGYGKTINEGDCVDSTVGSLFNPGEKFVPSKLTNLDWQNNSIVTNVMSLRHLYVEREKPDTTGFVFNNMQDARCFSDENHYAYQVPNYFEEPYPTFYCVDDVHSGVIKADKQIKGTDCNDFDMNYKPPLVKPQPDKDGYKDSDNVVTY